MTEILVAARFAHIVSLTLLTGIALFSVLVSEPAFRHADDETLRLAVPLRRRLTSLAWLSLALALVSGAFWFVAVAVQMSGGPALSSVTGTTLWTVAIQTQFGHVSLIRLIFAIGAGIRLAMRGWRFPPGFMETLAILSLLGSIAWLGHAGATEGLEGYLHLGGDIFHLLAAGAWLGGLVPLVLVFAATGKANSRAALDITRRITTRFSILGMIAVATLLATGILNSWFMIGTIPALLGTGYGQLVLVKVALFAAMAGIAAINRLALTPRLLGGDSLGGRDTAAALWRLKRNAAIETLLGLLVLGAVALLGTMPPGAHSQPDWPLPFALDLDLAADHGAILAGMFALALAGLLLLTLAAGGWQQSRNWGMAGMGLVLLIGSAAASFELLAVPAYPTSFYASPVAFDTASIERGQSLFAQHCVSCHGPDGRGDGPLAKDLKIPPADLTAEHIFGHRDGDLFWWIGNGIGDGAMPGFDGILDRTQRWDLINFIHARASGVLTSNMSAEVTASPAPIAPDFVFEPAPGRQESLKAIIGPNALLLVFYSLPDSAARLQQLALQQEDLQRAGLSILALPAAGTADSGAAAIGAGTLPDFTALAAQDVAASYCLFARLPPPATMPEPSRPMEFLIDRTGYIRARWMPGDRPDWADLPTLIEQARKTLELALPHQAAPHHAH